jgi:hypothetical protein
LLSNPLIGRSTCFTTISSTSNPDASGKTSFADGCRRALNHPGWDCTPESGKSAIFSSGRTSRRYQLRTLGLKRHTSIITYCSQACPKKDPSSLNLVDIPSRALVPVSCPLSTTRKGLTPIGKNRGVGNLTFSHSCKFRTL